MSQHYMIFAFSFLQVVHSIEADAVLHFAGDDPSVLVGRDILLVVLFPSSHPICA